MKKTYKLNIDVELIIDETMDSYDCALKLLNELNKYNGIFASINHINLGDSLIENEEDF